MRLSKKSNSNFFGESEEVFSLYQYLKDRLSSQVQHNQRKNF